MDGCLIEQRIVKKINAHRQIHLPHLEELENLQKEMNKMNSMKIGMLWFDNDPKADLLVKIGRASSHYEKKYGQKPNLVFVHPSMTPRGWNGSISFPDTEIRIQNGEEFNDDTWNKIEIRANRSILPNYFWIGVGEE